ncbi:probable calcium-binding protein CML25 [Cynara cardunculus var. scolymus]|uniref:Calcium-binding EF-hand n=1 Tax=Cynara cardunculus var. scolymus TaxID=59895 RepID=A0A118K366_CYNCS|nr:probable calcium-binding protein CML25 [Cynara cardunculus var. scolymus]KVI05443.1 Calcium-binding EF-hand [Cynara cardunculus var. scolymus]
MGLRNLLNRKNKNSKEKTSEKGVVEDTELMNTTPAASRVDSYDAHVRIEEELEQVFKKFDVNGDGKISSSELGSIMGSLGQRPSEDELKKMILDVDADGDGFIDLQEFIELNTKGIDSAELMENLKDAFSVFDIDKNGSITAEELQNVLGSLGEDCSLGECRRMIDGVDQDGDGMISFDEFKVMMMGPRIVAIDHEMTLQHPSN